jgi:hypothetical protein
MAAYHLPGRLWHRYYTTIGDERSRPAAWASLANHILETDGRFQGRTHRMKRHIPGLLTHNAVYRDSAPPLERLYRRPGMRPEITIHPLRGHVPLIGGAVCQYALKAADDITGRSLLQRRHGTAVRECLPGLRADNPVDSQACPLLEGLDGGLRLWSEDPIHCEP